MKVKKFSKFPSIEQYRTTVKNIISSAEYDGEGNHDENIPKPKIRFTGTIKLHGTSAAVGFNGENIWAQKRTGRINLQKDNFDFAFFVESRKEVFEKLFDLIYLPPKSKIYIYGEWCGRGVQKNVAISELEKMFVIFDIKIMDEHGDSTYLPEGIISTFMNCKSKKLFLENRIFNIYDFPTFSLNIDFNNPGLVQNDLVKITEEVEKECPVAKQFGVSGLGEGVVWRGTYKDAVHRFKVKGEKHSESKTKTLAPINVEKIASYNKFVKYAVTENRLQHGIHEIFTSNDTEPSKRGTGDFLRWIVNDIIKEEMETIKNSCLEPKMANKYISQYAKDWFFKYLDNI